MLKGHSRIGGHFEFKKINKETFHFLMFCYIFINIRYYIINHQGWISSVYRSILHFVKDLDSVHFNPNVSFV